MKNGQCVEQNDALVKSDRKILDSFYSTKELNFIRFSKGGRIRTDLFPSGLAKAPFIWDYVGTRYEMEFLGGFVGVKQDPLSLFLRPEIGWIVREAKT